MDLSKFFGDGSSFEKDFDQTFAALASLDAGDHGNYLVEKEQSGDTVRSVTITRK